MQIFKVWAYGSKRARTRALMHDHALKQENIPDVGHGHVVNCCPSSGKNHGSCCLSYIFLSCRTFGKQLPEDLKDSAKQPGRILGPS